MNCHLYNWAKIKGAKLVCICDSRVDADKLAKFGWAATVLLDDDHSESICWMFSTHDVVDLLAGKRVVLLPHQDVEGTVRFHYALVRLVEVALDVRVVHMPVGLTVTGFLQSIRTATEASGALDKVIDQAMPITSYAAHLINEALHRCRHELSRQTGKDWWLLAETIEHAQAQLRMLQKREAGRRSSK
jgi:hypothetical protein